MLTQFDFELYPEDCEVVEMPLHNQFVYLIQKNGSSSIRLEVESNNLKVFKNQDIKSLKFVDFYVKDPTHRYLTGMRTFVRHLKRDNPLLDEDTCIWFASHYNFLNTHYLPQFLWLLNLSRYLSPDCMLRFRPIEDMYKITEHTMGKQTRDRQLNNDIESKITATCDQNVDAWIFLDQMLRDMCGKSFTVSQVIDQIKNHPSGCFDIITKRFEQIAKVILS